MKKTLISIIMVNYNGKTFIGKNELRDAISSFLETKYAPLEFIFVDNNSNDDSVKFAEKIFEDYKSLSTKIIRNENNLGFAGGCEEGLKSARGRYIVLVNNDNKVVDPNWLVKFIRVLEQNDNIGAVFCKTIKWDEPTLLDSKGLTMTPPGLMAMTDIPEDKISECLVWQTPVMFRREITNKIGGFFDRDYVILNDDTDSSIRIWLAGYRILYVPTVFALHKRSATMKNLPTEFVCFHGRKNTIQTLIKNYEMKNLIRWLPVTLIIYLAAIVYFLFKKRVDQAKATLYAILWNIKNSGRIMKKRRYIQKNVRRTSDDVIFRLMRLFNLMEVIRGEKIWPK